MLCRSALSRLAITAQAPKRPTNDVTYLTRRFHRIALFNNLNGSVRTIGRIAPAYSRSLTSDAKPVGRPKKGGAVTAKASTRRTTKTTASAKAKPKKKKAATKKAAPKKKAKKVLTDAQKASAEKKKQAAEVKALKVTALFNKEPKSKPATAWTVFNSENVTKGSLADVRQSMKSNAHTYRNLTPAEREHYNHLANENKAENEDTYSAWVNSHTAEEIRNANIARRRLKLLLKDGKAKKSSFSPIQDERQVKLPRGSYNLFYTERQKSGDFKQISIEESAKLASSEWKALTQSEKKKYEDLHEEDFQRYLRQFKATYGYDAPSANGHSSASSSATI